METTEKSLMPQMSAPVGRTLFDTSAVGKDGAAVTASNCENYCRNAARKNDCIARCKASLGGGIR